METKIEDAVEAFVQTFRERDVIHGHNVVTQPYPDVRDWLRKTLTSIADQSKREVIGEIGAKLLAKHSPQIVLDAYFDVANEELEQNENDN